MFDRHSTHRLPSWVKSHKRSKFIAVKIRLLGAGLSRVRGARQFQRMKLTTFFVLGVAALALAGRAEGQGQDQFVFGISGGVAIPSGVAADNHKAGPIGGVMLGIGGVDSPFGVRFDGMYAAFGSKTGTGTLGLGKAKVTNVSVNALFTLIGDAKRLYFVGGVGGFNYNPDGSGTKATNDLSLNAGLGLWLPMVDGFVEARWFNLYRALPDDAGLNGKRPMRFYPISLGIMF